MGIYLVSEAVKVFSSMKPEEKVFISWLGKEDVIEKINDFNLDDDDEVEVVAEAIATDDFVESVFHSISDNDYVWERFNESYSDIVYEKTMKAINQIKEDKELWDTETEKA